MSKPIDLAASDKVKLLLGEKDVMIAHLQAQHEALVAQNAELQAENVRLKASLPPADVEVLPPAEANGAAAGGRPH